MSQTLMPEQDTDENGRETPAALQPLDGENLTLRDRVRPPDWVNPTPGGRYNLVVIGAGTAGLVTAAGAAMLGAKVALVERSLLGGDCLNTGCVPSKALLRAARAAADARASSDFGVRLSDEPAVDFPAVMQRMRRLRARIGAHDAADRFRGLGIDVYLGEAKFVGRDALSVDGVRLAFARACIATGARAAPPPIPGLAEAGYLTNETVFSLTDLPPRLAVIGAGPIGCELAQAFARFGAQVTLIEAEPRILPREDPDAAAIVRAALQHDGVRIVCGGKAAQVAARGEEKVIDLECEGKQEQVVVDRVLVGVGRAPNVEALDLERAGVAYDKRGVTVNDRLRTTNRRVFAAGDVCSKFKFTHAADAMARIVIQNALFFGRSRASDLVIPWCTYTDPELAHVGLTEAQAREQGRDVRTWTKSFDEIDRAILDGEDDGLLKIVATERKGRVLGATLVARHAGEMIGTLSQAMTHGLTLADLSKTIHPYPTQAEAIRKIGDDLQRDRVRPWMLGLTRKLLAWRR